MLRRFLVSLGFAFGLVAAVWSGSNGGGKYRIELALPASFNEPLLVKPYPHDDFPGEPLAVVEKRGRIFLASEGGKKELFMDISGEVCTKGYEEGLLGLAFAPDYAKSGVFYIYYSLCNPRESVIERVKKVGGEKGFEREKILRFAQPYSNHNGGNLEFGPDGMLYVGTGDGGSAGDPNGNAQNLDSLLGKMLRIDVSGEKGYKIPPDNPFIERGRPEIFAYGLRNPWRFTFDQKTGLLWAGDVGQDKYEEVSVVKRGDNLGWNTMEGFHCFKPESGCVKKGLAAPRFEYDHKSGQSITGGYVYYGAALAQLRGHYIFGDFVNGSIWAISASGASPQVEELLINSDLNISSFGLDHGGEILVVGFYSGRIYRLVR